MPAHHYGHKDRATFVRKDRRLNTDATANPEATPTKTTLAAASPPSSIEHDVHVHVQPGTEKSGQDVAEEASVAADEHEDENEVADRLMARCLMAAGYALAVRYALPSGGHMASLAESGFARVCFDGAPWPSAQTVWIHHLSGDSPPSVLSFRRPLGRHHSHSEELFISVSGAGEHDVDVMFGAESRQIKDEAWMIQEPQGWSARLRCDRSGDVGQVEDGEQDSEAATEQ